MAFGGRLPAIAIGVALGTTVALGQEAARSVVENEPIPETRQQNQGSSNNDHIEAEKLVPALQAIEDAIRDLIAEDDAIEARRQEQREAADLSAQQDMAFWSKLMFWATGGTVLLTLAGVILIWRTLHHTRIAAEHTGKAVDEARIATKAAQDAVAVTEDIGKRQLRAYVDIGTVEIEERTWINPNELAAGCGVKLHNFGQTPAYNVSYWIQAGVRAIPPIEVFEHGQMTGHGNIGPSSLVVMRVRPVFSAEHANAVTAGAMGLYVWGRVTYSDAFSEQREISFNFLSTGLSFTGGRFKSHEMQTAT